MSKKAVLNCRLIDGTGREPVNPGTIIVDGNRITAVGPGDAISIPSGAERINAEGRTVLPGLIDGHIHVTTLPAFLDARGHLTQSLRAVGKLRKCLGWGTTTTANMGGCPENVILRQALEEGHVTGCARMLVAAMVNPTGGHVRGRAADGPWEVRKAVREMVAAGVDLIKTSSSGGFQWEHEELGQPDYTLEELKALADEAHAKGKLVSVHAHAQPGLNIAIEAGCDIICHGVMIDDEALDGIRAKDLSYMPTLYITSERSFSRAALPEHMKRRMKQAHSIHRAGVRKAHEMGIRISVGTDGGPGDVMHEIVELVACGLSPMEAIVAATRNTAQALGIGDRLGTLEPGKKADLVIVEGDPLSNVSCLVEPRADLAIVEGDPLSNVFCLVEPRNVLLVMKDGKVEITDESLKRYIHPRD